MDQLKTNMTWFLFEIRDPLVKDSVSNFLVLDFTSEAFGNYTGIEITPIWYIFIKLVFLIDLFGSFWYE